MKIAKGESRLVVVLPGLGIVIKFSIIHLVIGFRVLWYDLSRKGNRLHDELFRYTIEMSRSLKRLLFKGIVDNWREWRFYQRTRHPFCQPTYLSLFGLLNIQRFARPCTLQENDLWCQLHELTKGAVFKDSHHFTNPDNFCLNGEGLRILDYGGLKTQEVVQEFGDNILQNFDPNYSWEERKKELKAKREASS